MEILRTTADMRRARAGRTAAACVPTMGNLHEGHLGLMRLARQHGSTVIATIFVNDCGKGLHKVNLELGFILEVLFQLRDLCS